MQIKKPYHGLSRRRDAAVVALAHYQEVELELSGRGWTERSEGSPGVSGDALQPRPPENDAVKKHYILRDLASFA